MSDELKLPEGVTSIDLGPKDGAIIVREDGVELLLPDIDLDAMLPNHLVPLMALSMILGDEKKLQEAIDHLNKSIEDIQNRKT